MKKINIIILLFAIFFVTVAVSNSIKFQATPLKKLNPQFVESMSSPSIPEQTQAPLVTKITESGKSVSTKKNSQEQTYINYYPSDEYPITVSKELSHNININYTTDIICIKVEATNIGDKTLDDIDIYETVPSRMNIINCSVPILESSIDEYLRWTRSGYWLFTSNDIQNPKGLAKKLMSSKTSTNLTISFLYNDSAILNNYSHETNSNLSSVILKRFNKFILNSELENQTKYINNGYLFSQTKKLLDMNIANKLQKDDQKLLSFLILRDSYESYIRKPEGYIKINEEYGVEEEAGLIHIALPRLHPKETMIFKYFTFLSSHELQNTKTIVGISGNKFPNHLSTLDISFPFPQFTVNGDYSKQEVQPGEFVTIKYIIQLLNPISLHSKYSFNAQVENNDSDISIDPSPDLFLNFASSNYSCEETIKISINKPGVYNIPALSIGDYEYGIIDKNIKVDPLWNKYILEITIMFLAFCTLLGNNLKELMQRENLIYRIIFAIGLLIIALITFYLCEFPDIYYPLSALTIIIIIVYWWNSSLK